MGLTSSANFGGTRDSNERSVEGDREKIKGFFGLLLHALAAPPHENPGWSLMFLTHHHYTQCPQISQIQEP